MNARAAASGISGRPFRDAAHTLNAHLDALVLVGAQAVRLHTSGTNLAVVEYAADADPTIGPAELADAPLIAELMATGGFRPRAPRAVRHAGQTCCPTGEGSRGRAH